MPEASKNVAIGVLVAIALGLVLWVLLFLHPSFGDGALKLHVRFADIEKISVGTRVTYAGRPVGEVVKITQVPEEERYASNKDPSQIYTYDLTLAIDSHIPVYDSDEITIGTSGLMGERFISIIPKRPKDKPAALLTSHEVIYSETPPSVEDAFTQISSLASKAEKAIDSVSALIKENRDDVSTTLRSFKNAAHQLDVMLVNANKSDLISSLNKASTQVANTMAICEQALNKIDQSALIAKLTSTADHLESITKSLDQPEQLKTLVASANSLCTELKETSANLSRSWPKVEQAIDSITNAANSANQTANTVEALVTNVANGEGSIGKMLVSNDFYIKTVAIMNKADTLMNDVNHYGVLYHLDKGWQRERRKRMDEITRLDNPQEFKKFLEDELFKINTSVATFGQALQKAESVANTDGSVTSDYTRTFNALLNQIQDLQGTLNAYSIQLAEKKVTPELAEVK